jgi:hypothetical protein
MSTPHERLRAAREAAGYDTATLAASAMGLPVATYTHHENGTNGLSRSGERYAKFFRVNLDWLLQGRGPMRGAAGMAIPVTGYAEAGKIHINTLPQDLKDVPDVVEFPSGDDLSAFIVRGDSQMPRISAGEIVVYRNTPRQPAEVLGRLVLAQTLDGQTLVKTVSPSTKPNKWRLDSPNAAAIETEILGCWEVVAIVIAAQHR